jgi:hypothetical protein
MTKIDRIKDNPRQFIAFTSLNQAEFMALLQFFAPLCEQYYEHNDFKGHSRSMSRIKERSDSSLSGSVNKLLFILSYMKENATQAYHGLMFGMSQGKVSMWIKQLAPLLEESLKKMKKLPSRCASILYQVLSCSVETVLLMDVTERKIGRSTDMHVQKEYYSGKKGTHTIKNLLLTNQQGKVLFLGETFQGSTHDKKLYEKAELTFPDKDQCLLVDLGFQGIDPQNVLVVMPEKKPKGKELSSQQKSVNTFISSIRVKVEHDIAGVKRCRIIRNKVRLHGLEVRDRIMNIACGLHNLRSDRWIHNN